LDEYFFLFGDKLLQLQKNSGAGVSFWADLSAAVAR
jgi:hypothetical protein